MTVGCGGSGDRAVSTRSAQQQPVQPLITDVPPDAAVLPPVSGPSAIPEDLPTTTLADAVAKEVESQLPGFLVVSKIDRVIGDSGRIAIVDLATAMDDSAEHVAITARYVEKPVYVGNLGPVEPSSYAAGADGRARAEFQLEQDGYGSVAIVRPDGWLVQVIRRMVAPAKFSAKLSLEDIGALAERVAALEIDKAAAKAV